MSVARKPDFFKRAIEVSAAPIVIADATADDYPIVYVNAAFSRLTGFKAEECLGKNCRFLQGADRNQPGMKGVRDALKVGRYVATTVRNYRKDGTLFWNRLVISPLYDQQKRLTHYIGIQTDITEIKDYETQILIDRDRAEKGRQLLKQVLLLAKAGYWEYDPRLNTLEWSDEICAMFGLHRDHFPATFEGFRQLVHPDDRAAVEAAFETHLRDGQPYVIPHRVCLADGNIKYVQERCETLYDAQGKAPRMLGVVLDVTETHEQQEEIRQLFDSMAQGVVYQDVQGKITKVNSAALRLLGLDYGQITARDSKHPGWRAVREDGSEFPGDEHPSMVALRTGEPVPDTLMGIYRAVTDDTVWILVNAKPEFRAGQERPWRVFTTFTDVTDLKMKEAALQESEARSRAVFSAIRDMIFILDSDGGLLDCLAAQPAQLYAPQQEFLGQNIRQVLPEDVALPILKALKDCVEQRRTQQVTYSLPFAGHLQWFEATLTVLDTSRVLAVVRDITASKTMENALREHQAVLERRVAERTAQLEEQEQLYRGLVESQHDLIVRVDRDNCFTYVNDAYCKFFGKSREELLGSPFAPMVHADDMDRTLAALQQLELPPHRACVEQRAFARDGWRWIAWEDSAILDEDGKIWEIQGVGRDITEMKAAQEAIESASRAKTEFLARMSHEIRTPLNAIIGFARILIRELPEGGRPADHVRTILQSSEHLISMANELLDVGKIESGRIAMFEEPFDLQALLSEVVEIFRSRAGQKGVKFLFVATSEIPRLVRGDPTKLRQVFFNLLDNAVKFTSGGQITLRVGFGGPSASGGGILNFEVEDTGCGIPAAEMSRLFDDFFQGEMGKGFGGTGLGLPICRKLLRLMGGDIQVDTQPKSGSLFRGTMALTSEAGGEVSDGKGENRICAPSDLQDKVIPDLVAYDVSVLPDEIRRAMGNALADGDMAAMRLGIEQIRFDHPDLAEKIRTLAELYDYHGLEKLLSESVK